MNSNTLHFPSAIALVVLALCSCSKTEEKQEEQTQGFLGGFMQKPTNPNQAPKYTEPTIDNLMGKPQLFPSEYPVEQYPNSKMVVAEVRPSYSARRPNMVTLESNDPIPNIAYYYKQKLQSQGWKFKEATENTAYSSTMWEKGKQKAEIRVCPAPDPNERVIQLLIYPSDGR